MVDLSRTDLIRKRWLIWIATVVLAAAATLSLSIWQRDLLLKAVELKTERLIVLGGGTLGVVLWLASKGWNWFAATLDLNHFCEHPPYWVACATGSFGALLLSAEVDSVGESIGFMEPERSDVAAFIRYIALPLIVLFVGLFVLNWCRRKRASSNKEASAKPKETSTPAENSPSPTMGKDSPTDHSRLLIADIERLEEWIRHDNPICDERHDLFGHGSVARRIVDRLMQAAYNRESRDVSQAIVGNFGSGKSSVLSLVKREISKRGTRELRIVDIPMWPYSTSRAAVVGVVESLVKALSAEVNTISLRGVPAAYAEAIASAPGGRIALAALRPSVENPANVLRSVDEVARVIGVHYVVWIEDLERFSSGSDGEEKLEIVRALLHGLHVLPSFTIVTASTDLSDRVDMDKIARFVERVPDLSAESVRSICSRFMSKWREQAVLAKCVEVESRNEWRSTREDIQYAEAILGSVLYDIPTGIAGLLTSPRLLKRALRQCQEAWRVLLGEVDLSELFALCAIREACPRVFSLIDSNINILRDGSQKQIDEVSSPLARVWRMLQEEIAHFSKMKGDAIECLIKEVFLRADKRRRLQGFGTKLSHVDYWHRFNAQPELPSTSRDQYVLKVMRDSCVDNSLNVLEDEGYAAAAVVHLARLVAVERLVEFVVPLTNRFTNRAQRQGVRVSYTRRFSGFHTIRTALLAHPDFRSVEDRLVQALSEAVRRCAEEYAFDVLWSLELFFFAAPTPNFSMLITEEKAILLRQQLRSALVSMCVNPERVVNGLKSCEVWMLSNLIWGARSVESGAYLDPMQQPCPEWQKLANVLLEALELEPDVVAGSIAHLVSSPTRFEPALCLARFSDSERAMRGIARGLAGKEWALDIYTSLLEFQKKASSHYRVGEYVPVQILDSERFVDVREVVEMNSVAVSPKDHETGNEAYTERTSSLTPSDQD